MIWKLSAVLVFGCAFGVFFLDELYRFGGYEWLPNVLGSVLIVTSLFLWDPSRWKRQP